MSASGPPRDAGEWFPEGVIELGPSGWIFWTLVLAAFTVQWAVQAIRNDRPNAYIALALTGMFGAAVFKVWFIINDTGFALAAPRSVPVLRHDRHLHRLLDRCCRLPRPHHDAGTVRSVRSFPGRRCRCCCSGMRSPSCWVTWIAIFVIVGIRCSPRASSSSSDSPSPSPSARSPTGTRPAVARRSGHARLEGRRGRPWLPGPHRRRLCVCLLRRHHRRLPRRRRRSVPLHERRGCADHTRHGSFWPSSAPSVAPPWCSASCSARPCSSWAW